MKTNLHGLSKEDLALLLHGIRAIYVADMEARRVKLEERLLSELAMYGVSDVKSVSAPVG
jgi:hypothetical protein